MTKISDNTFKMLASNEETILRIKKENEVYFTIHNQRKKFLILTYGCQMNEHDSENLAKVIENMGYEVTAFQEQADLIIINTCCVRENAELKVYGKIGSFKALKLSNPNLVIAICGCMMQQEHIVTEIKSKYRHVDIVFGTHNVYNFPNLLEQSLNCNKTLVQVWDIDGEVIEVSDSDRKYELKAYVNIMFGCNNFCTFCIVPYTRGRERSREQNLILEEIRDLVSKGTKEITLLGQNVNSYGKTLDNPISFSELLEEVANIEGLQRIKFMSSHPKDMSIDVLKVMSKYDNIAKYIHLPIQAGSNELLKAMNRGYTKESYLEIVKAARELMPNISISTDLIIGFPGETEDDIDELLDLLELVQYDFAFTFKYSQRKGTPADEMTNQISKSDKTDRFNVVLNKLNSIVVNKNEKMKNKTVSILVEGFSKKKDLLTGRTEGSKIVNFKGDSNLIGKFVYVNITEPRRFTLTGVLID